MSKQYRVSLPASRLELTQVLARLQEDVLEEPDRQLLMRLVQQLLGSSGGTPSPEPPTAAGKNESALMAGWSETTSPEQEAHTSERPGHGRRSASDYPGAKRVSCHDPLRQAGDRCGCGGKLYEAKTPAVFLRFTGQPLVGATCYEQTVLRCSSCQQRFPAPLPEGVPAEKYDATADVAIVMAKYAAGLPFHRLAQMQEAFGVPLPPSVQWERAETVADALLPVVPKPLLDNRALWSGIWRDVDSETEPAGRSEMMMSALFASSLLGRVLRTPIGDASRQHTVQHDQHRMSDRQNSALLPATRRELLE